MTESVTESDTAESSRAAVLIAQLHATLDELSALDVTGLSDADLVDTAAELERAASRMPFSGDRMISEIDARGLPRALGYRNLIGLMAQRLRIGEPGKRREAMHATLQRRDVSGQPIEPRCPTLSEAVADGHLSPKHVATALDVLDKIPARLDHATQVAAERTLVQVAVDLTPAQIGQVGQRLLAHLDPDGTLTDDDDRSRRRGLWLSQQRADGTSTVKGVVDALTRARLEAVLAAWATAGANNPHDPDSPHGADAVDPQAAERDGRSQAQRNHDGFSAFLADGLDTGRAGRSHRGMPVQLIIKVDEADLRRRAGLGVTATGTLLPMRQVVEMAAAAEQHLAVFARHSTVPLYFGTSKRLATRGQRLALFAAPGGEVCCAPGCDQPATHLEIHHAVKDFGHGGRTDIAELKGVCPRHHRMVGDKLGQYATSIPDHGPHAGRVLWRRNTAPGQPPDSGRINLMPNIGQRFTQNLTRVRADVHTPAAPPRRDPMTPPLLTHTDIRDAGLSTQEIRLAALINRRAEAINHTADAGAGPD